MTFPQEDRYTWDLFAPRNPGVGTGGGANANSAFAGNAEHRYANGVSTQVLFWLPTATSVGSLKDGKHGNLKSQEALNVGARYDRYSGWLPEQEQLAGSTGSGRTARVTT